MEPELTKLMATSRDPERLAVLWREWREETGKKMSDLFEDMVSLMNDGARHNGIMYTLLILLLVWSVKESKEICRVNTIYGRQDVFCNNYTVVYYYLKNILR